MIRSISILLLVASFQSCSIFRIISVDESNHESVEEYQEFLSDCGIETPYSFQIKGNYLDSISSSKNYCLNLYKFDKQTSASPVQIRMYDREGKLLMGWEQCYGSLKHFDLFDSVPLRNVRHLPNNYELALNKDIEMLDVSEVERNKVINYTMDNEYTLLIMYSVWGGWYSKNALQLSQEYTQANDNIAFILLNTANYKKNSNTAANTAYSKQGCYSITIR